MHKANAVLIIAMALVLAAAPCTALAYKKKGAAPTKGEVPRESINLNFSKIQHKYTQPTKSTSDVGGIKSNASR